MGNKLEKIAGQILSGCRSVAFDGITPVYTPDAKGFYQSMYWRDFCYTIEGFGKKIPIGELELAVRYLLEPLKEGATFLHKCRNADGKIEFNWQDPYPSEDVSSSATASFSFSADNPMFAVKVVDEYLRLGGEVSLFKEYLVRLERVMKLVPLSDNNLVEDNVGPYMYGFYDTISLTGEECFASLLFYDASLRLARIFHKIGEEKKAELWQNYAEKTKSGLNLLWNKNAGMFISDTRTNRQIDVWGSAFAVYLESISDVQAEAISRWFVKNFDRCVKWGHVRHIPYPEYWKGPFTEVVYPRIQPYGHYQNGGYWSVPTPWVVRTIALTDMVLAKRMVLDLEKSLVDYYMPECINEDGSCKLPGYTASAAMGLTALKILEE